MANYLSFIRSDFNPLIGGCPLTKFDEPQPQMPECSYKLKKEVSLLGRIACLFGMRHQQFLNDTDSYMKNEVLPRIQTEFHHSINPSSGWKPKQLAQLRNQACRLLPLQLTSLSKGILESHHLYDVKWDGWGQLLSPVFAMNCLALVIYKISCRVLGIWHGRSTETVFQELDRMHQDFPAELHRYPGTLFQIKVSEKRSLPSSSSAINTPPVCYGFSTTVKHVHGKEIGRIDPSRLVFWREGKLIFSAFYFQDKLLNSNGSINETHNTVVFDLPEGILDSPSLQTDVEMAIHLTLHINSQQQYGLIRIPKSIRTSRLLEEEESQSRGAQVESQPNETWMMQRGFTKIRTYTNPSCDRGLDFENHHMWAIHAHSIQITQSKLEQDFRLSAPNVFEAAWEPTFEVKRR